MELKDLVTNKEGELCIKGNGDKLTPVDLLLKKGKYVIKENTAPDGYQKAEDHEFTVGDTKESIILTNTKKGEDPKPQEDKVNITVTKKWQDRDGNDMNAPVDEVLVTLVCDDAEMPQQATLNAENNWTFTFENLDAKTSNGTAHNYTVKESGEVKNSIKFADKTYTVMYKTTNQRVEIINKLTSNKPVEPGTPDNPNPNKPTPDKPHKPEKPSTPEKPLTPEKPSTPEGKRPETYPSVKVYPGLSVPTIPRAGVGA